jgi:hypothetical protein
VALFTATISTASHNSRPSPGCRSLPSKVKAQATTNIGDMFKAGKINLGIDIKSLFSSQVVIDHFYLDKAEIKVVVRQPKEPKENNKSNFI